MYYVSTKSCSHLFNLKVNQRNSIRLRKSSNKVKERREIIGASIIESLPRRPHWRDDKKEYWGEGKA